MVAAGTLMVVNNTNYHSSSSIIIIIIGLLITIMIATSPSVSTIVPDPIALVIMIISTTADGHKVPLLIDITTTNIIMPIITGVAIADE